MNKKTPHSKRTKCVAVLLSAELLLTSSMVNAQQFYSDNQWVAP